MKKINIYYLGLFVLCLKNWLFISKLMDLNNIIDKLINLVTILIFGIIILNQKYTKKEVIAILIIGLSLLINALCINEYIFFLDFLAIISSKKIYVNNIIKFIYNFNIIMIIIHIIFTATAILLNVNGNEYITYFEGVARYNFYMRHTNYFAAVVFWTLAMYICLHKNKSALKNIVLICAIGIISYLLTKSRTSLILYAFFVLLTIISSKERLKNSIINATKYIFPIIFIILSFITINFFNFSNSIYNFLLMVNDLFSYRLILGVVGYYNYGLTFFGQALNYYDAIHANNFYIDTLVVDSFFVSCLINYGIIIIIFFTVGIYKLAKKLDMDYLIYIILLIVVSITERYIPYICVCFPILFFKFAIFEKEIDKV